MRYNSILLVDDDPTQIAILSAYFGSLRAQTIMHAPDGEKALELVEENRQTIDLIVTDLSMPKMDGIEFLRCLKQQSFKGEVVLISSFGERMMDNAVKLGELHGLKIGGRISKPLTKKSLDKVFVSHDRELKDQAPKQKCGDEVTKEQILAGLEASQFVPFYQPKVDMLTGSIVGAEALARWQVGEEKFLSPIKFIPVAEKHDLIEAITWQIFENVAQDKSRNRQIWHDHKISVNLSPSMVSDITLPDRISAMLQKHNISPKEISLEVTETDILEFDTETIEVMSRLNLAGFELSIDDFGTGASNISNLRVFPYSELKIDQSFINNVLTDAFSWETVRTSISLARQLDMKVVAEGIETREIFDLVKANGIDCGQGYFIAKPMPAKDITAYFESPYLWLSSQAPPTSHKVELAS